MIELPPNYVTRAEIDEAIENWWYRLGHRTGWDEGFEAGIRYAEELEARRFAPVAALVRTAANTPTFAELKERRNRPSGGEEYTGGPVELW